MVAQDIAAVVAKVGPRITEVVIGFLDQAVREAQAPELARLTDTLAGIIEGTGSLDQLRRDCLLVMASAECVILPPDIAGMFRPVEETECSPLWNALADLVLVTASAARVDWLTFTDELSEMITDAPA